MKKITLIITMLLILTGCGHDFAPTGNGTYKFITARYMCADPQTGSTVEYNFQNHGMFSELLSTNEDETASYGTYFYKENITFEGNKDVYTIEIEDGDTGEYTYFLYSLNENKLTALNNEIKEIFSCKALDYQD